MNESGSPPNNGSGSDGPDAGAPGSSGSADVTDVLDAELAAMLADEGTWVHPPHGLGDRVVAAIRSEADLGTPGPSAPIGPSSSSRRRAGLRPALIGAAAAVVLLFGGIVVLSAVSGVEEVETFSVELVSTGLIPDVGGALDVTAFDSGLQIELSAPGLPRRDDGAFYTGWVRSDDGNLTPVGTFHDGTAVTLWAGVELDRIELFTITLERAAGPDDPAQGSSGDVVLRAALRP